MFKQYQGTSWMSLMYKCVTGGNQGMTNFDVKLVILDLFKFGGKKYIMLWEKSHAFFCPVITEKMGVIKNTPIFYSTK